MFLDSDDELKPDGLSVMRRHIEREREDADCFGFMYEWDTGIVSPDPPPDGSLLDYEGWMGVRKHHPRLGRSALHASLDFRT